jgi:predicted PolB exonuclease-like 3'-5' exonuclease
MNYLDQAHIENFLYIDIETLPDGEKMSIEEAKKEAPKNYKKEEVIQAWAEKHIEEEYKKRSLKSEEGRIYCICYAMNNEPVKTIEYKDEKQMMEEFVDDLYTSYDRTLATCGWVGHNIRNFDLPWLIHRMWKYGTTKIIYLLPMSPKDHRVIDTSEKWGLTSFKNYTSLDSICKFLGFKTKEGIDGSQVYDYFLKGEHGKVYEYCRDDVDERLRPLHNIMRGT